jgi:phage baseplate assembly protein gpV
MELYDGTVLPSYLEMAWVPRGGPGGSMNDTTLRVGEVVQAYSPTDPANKDPRTKNKRWVYVVNVSYRDGSGTRSVVPYRCTVGGLFGGVGDRMRYSVRQASRVPTSKSGFADGAQVLILCVNGDKSNATIIGSLRHEDDKTPEPDKAFFDFQFNGVKATIDEFGALVLKVPGATKLDGTPDDNRDENNKGTQVSFGKDGSIAITDGNGDTVTVSPKDKSITVTAGEQTTTVEKAWKLKAATVEIEADSATVNAKKVLLGGKELEINPLDEVVIGSGIDTFTGVPYKGLGSTSSKVKARK